MLNSANRLIPRFPCASVLKRVFVRNLSYENVPVGDSYESLYKKTHFDRGKRQLGNVILPDCCLLQPHPETNTDTLA